MKKFYKLLFFSLFMLSSAVMIKAQTNLAPQATATASTCNTGACATLNDLNFGTCGTQLMWITTGTPPSLTPGVEWIQFEWTSTKSLNKFIIHHAETASRFLNGGDIQAWTGTAWTTVSTFLNLTPACSSVVNFPTVATTRIRITSFRMSGTQLSNPNFREIEVFGPSVNNDAGVTFITTPNICTYTQKIDAVVTNLGKLRLDSFRLSWSVNNVFQNTQYINSNYTTGQFGTYTLSSAFTFSPNTSYTIRAWTSVPNGTSDSMPSNDLNLVTINFMGSPDNPTTTNFIQCGRGRPILVAGTSSPADSVYWYNQASGGSAIGEGKKFEGPLTVATRTFYAETGKTSAANIKITTTGTTGVNVRQTEPYGGMQTITTNKTIMMDSLDFRLWYATPTNCGYQLYYKTGAHTGFLTNPNVWTKLNEGVVTFRTIGGQNFGRVSAKKLVLPAGTYSFYLTTDLDFGAGNSFYSISNGPGIVGEDISILAGGNIIIGKFGSTQTLTYQPQIGYFYKKMCLSAGRTPLTVTVKPRPIGADVIKSTPFQGHFRFGNAADPDVVAVGKTLTYNMTPPSGYTNQDHGVTWIIQTVSAKTKNNTTVPITDYVVNQPSGSNNASLSFKPKSIWLDSTITFSVKFTDLGPHFCDSTVTRTIYVAPTPKPNFTFPSFICLGESTLFENLTTIHSGVASYKWYFGDGDSSDYNSPAHDFKTSGTFNVRLVATSFRWEVVHDTTIKVEIGEVPAVDFKVTNACMGSNLSFANITTIGSGTLTYRWDYGDNSPFSTSINTTKSYVVPGPYQVTLTAYANGCSASKTKVAYQFARPIANFIKQSGECLNQEFKFTNNSIIALGQFGNRWDFDDAGSIATDRNTNYTFTSPGMKNVKLVTISEFGCRDSITKQVLVKQIATTDFTYPYACDRTPTPFTNTTSLNGEVLNQYQWDFGNGQTTTVFSPTIGWPNVGHRLVKLKTTLVNGCVSEMAKDINVGVQPKPDFEFENKCSGEPVTFTNLTTYSNGKIVYEWNFGDNTITSTPAPQHLFNSGPTTQSFFVQLKASIIDGCADSIMKTITIAPQPATCDFTAVRDWSVNSKSFVLTPTGGNLNGNTYTWILGDGNRKNSISSGTNHTYNGNLKYCITMIAENSSGCECSKTNCVELSTDVDDINANANFDLYPNPNNGIFTVSAKETVTTMTVLVYSVTGELVYSKTIDSNKGAIDLSDNASGLYLVKVITNNTISTQLVTISK